MNKVAREILGDIKLVTDKGADMPMDGDQLVSAEHIPLDDARRIVRELEAAGFQASWAPSSSNDHSREQFAWLYFLDTEQA